MNTFETNHGGRSFEVSVGHAARLTVLGALEQTGLAYDRTAKAWGADVVAEVANPDNTTWGIDTYEVAAAALATQRLEFRTTDDGELIVVNQPAADQEV